MSNKFGLIGGKLGHSLSPAIHQLFFEYTGKTGSYELLETELEALPELMGKLREGFVGTNVTIPHKLHVMPLLDEIAPEAAAIGAVNTNLRRKALLATTPTILALVACWNIMILR